MASITFRLQVLAIPYIVNVSGRAPAITRHPLNAIFSGKKVTELLGNTVLGWVSRVVLLCSILHTLLPSWEGLSFSPKFQNGYRIFIYIIGGVAISLRSTVHPSISTQNGTQISQAAKLQIPGSTAEERKAE